MSGSRLVRGTRGRLPLYLGVVAVLGLAGYIFHGAQLQLDDARKAADKCQQQQESLSAQLQVIFEYKLRLEKSLQQEKTEHRQTREELEAKAAEEKQRRDKESVESMNKFSALQQQFKLLKSQHDDLNDDCKKIRVEQLHGLEERSKLESQVQAVQAELEQVQASHKKSLNSIKSEYMKLEVENDRLQKARSELQKGTSQTSDRINYLEKQNLQLQHELEETKKELNSYKRHVAPIGDTKHHNEDETLKSPSPSSPSSASSAAPDAGLNPESLNVLQEPLANQEVADNKVRSSTSSSSVQLSNKLFLPPAAQSSSSRPAPAVYGQQGGAMDSPLDNKYFLAPAAQSSSSHPPSALYARKEDAMDAPLPNQYLLHPIEQSSSSRPQVYVHRDDSQLFLAPVAQPSSPRPAPALYLQQDGALAAPPYNVDLEQLQKRLQQMLSQQNRPQRRF